MIDFVAENNESSRKQICFISRVVPEKEWGL